MILQKNLQNPFYNETDWERKASLEDAKARISIRDDFERDYGRILHSAAFRRLQAKTQVIAVSEGDFHRTRLTHSLEVAQIARGIATSLNGLSDSPETSDGTFDSPNGLRGTQFSNPAGKPDFLLPELCKIDTSLIEAAALAHDLGHPPFGHQGERALNTSMRAFDLNFEGNAHTFRLLTAREGHPNHGLNLTRATLLSVLKYPAPMKQLNNGLVLEKPPKSSVFDEDQAAFQWVLEPFSPEERSYLTASSDHAEGKHGKTLHKTFECSIVELADDIAYATYDLEDSLKLELIAHNHLLAVFEEHRDKCPARIANAIGRFIDGEKDEYRIKYLFADLVSGFINHVFMEENETLKGPLASSGSNRLRYRAVVDEGTRALLDGLKKLVVEHVIQSQRVQTFEWRGGRMIAKLFEAMIQDKHLLPQDEKSRWSSASDVNNARIVCDYIAGMTDNYALRMYSRLFESAGGKLFDI